MPLTKFSLRNPAVISVVVAIIFFVGLFSLAKLPLQLFPSIERPQVSIQTSWRAASPSEVESELLEPQEDVLMGIPGLVEMEAWANAGNSWMTLEFDMSTDMDTTLLDIISRLNRLPPLPLDAEPPQLILGQGGSSNETLSFFFIQSLPGNTRPVLEYAKWVNDYVIPRVESVPGVSQARLEVGQGAEEEIQIEFDPFLAAQYGIEIPTIARSAGRANDVSGGFVDVGRRLYTLRFEGRRSPEELADQILEWRDGKPIRLGDIATVNVGRGRNNGFAYQNGNPALGLRVNRESGANVLSTLDAVKEVLWDIRDGPMEEQGLTIAQSYDPSVFIRRAIGLLTSNLMIGIVLAIGVLWWFLRQMRATFLIALTIPICLLATFVVLNFFGRTLNVISLAGLAFAVGMVLDAAIVVLENIVRLREQGSNARDASDEGAGQVWGALVASTATTVAIFTPVIFLKDVEGQLFSDLALTVAIGVTISLFVAVTVLPAAARHFLIDLPKIEDQNTLWKRMTAFLMRITDTPKRRISWIAGLMIVPVLATILLMPALNYLPPVKRDAVDGFVGMPPGTTTEVLETEVAQVLVERLKPYLEGEKEPALRNYYISRWAGNDGAGIGIRAKDQRKIKELETVVREEILADLPGAFAFSQQGNLFGGFGGDGTIEMHLQTKDSQVLREATAQAIAILNEAIPGAQINPRPNPEMAQPELRVYPRDDRIREAGWDRSDVATIVRAMGDGQYVGEYFNGEERQNIILKAKKTANAEDLENVPLATRSGGIVTLGQLASFERTVGPAAIRRVEGRRSISLQINPPQGMSLGTAVEIIEGVEPQIYALLPADGSILYGGSASGLKNAIKTMTENFLFALGLLFLILAALFKSMRDSLLVVVSIPLATVGGILALRLLNFVTFQPMDLLTMIGFIILLGLVVNNAILLVHQTRQGENNGLSRRDAVEQALQVRLRPIFMSTLTSIFGMLPMVVVPGVGSAIYRGLAATIVGGMCVSTLFTLILLPCLLRTGEATAPWIGKIYDLARWQSQGEDKKAA